MKYGRLLALGFGAYVLALIATAPATLVDAGLNNASKGRLRLAETQGTLWSGSGQLDIHDNAGRSVVARDIRWRFVPQSLFSAHLLFQLRLGTASQTFPVTISLSGIELANTDISLPAQVLAIAVPELKAFQLSGEVHFQISRLLIGHEQVEVNAILQWRTAGSALSPVSPLGDYELQLKNEGPALVAILRTLQGPLQLDGNGLWTRGSKPALLVRARVQRQQRQQLIPLLRLFSVERNDGSFELQIK